MNGDVSSSLSKSWKLNEGTLAACLLCSSVSVLVIGFLYILQHVIMRLDFRTLDQFGLNYHDFYGDKGAEKNNKKDKD